MKSPHADDAPFVMEDTAPRLRQAALTYIARNPTSTARLKSTLARRLKTWGIALDDAARAYIDDTLIPDLQRMRFLDDAAFARALAASYTRRGYAAPVARDRARKYGVDLPETDNKTALLHLMRRKHIGPFSDIETPAEVRAKQLAQMARKGFSLGLVTQCLALSRDEALDCLTE